MKVFVENIPGFFSI